MIGIMGQEPYIRRIEELLREMSSLERTLNNERSEDRRHSLLKSLKARRKRFECLIPYSFRQELRYICKQAGIKGEFSE